MPVKLLGKSVGGKARGTGVAQPARNTIKIAAILFIA
jgi:hypothetical protein